MLYANLFIFKTKVDDVIHWPRHGDQPLHTCVVLQPPSRRGGLAVILVNYWHCSKIVFLLFFQKKKTDKKNDEPITYLPNINKKIRIYVILLMPGVCGASSNHNSSLIRIGVAWF